MQLFRLFKDTVIYGLGRYLGLLASVFLVPIYTRILPPDQYGSLEIFTTLSTTSAVFAVVGLDAALGLYYYNETDELGKRSAATTNLVIRMGLALLIAGLGALMVPWIGPALLHTDRLSGLLLWTFAVFPFSILLGFSMDYLRLRLQPVTYSVINVGSLLVGITLNLVMVLVLRWGMPGLVIGNGITAIATAIVAFLAVRGGLEPTFSRPLAARMLRYGLPLLPASFANWIITFSDRYWMTHYLPLAQLGLYVVGLKVANFMNLVTASFQLAWAPYAFAIKDQPDARQTYARVLIAYLLVATTLAVGLGVFSREILGVLAARTYLAAATVASIQVLTPLMVGVYYVVAIGVNLTEKTAYISLTTAIAAVTSLALNAFLVPRIGIVGAASAALAAQVVSAAALYAISQRFYRIPFQVGRAVAILVVGGAAIAAAGRIPVGQAGGPLFKVGIFLAYLVALPALGLFGREERAAVAGAIARWRTREAPAG